MNLVRSNRVLTARLVVPALLAAALPAVLPAQTATFLSAQSSVGNGFQQPTGLALDSAGDLYVVDNTGNQVVKVAAGTSVQTTIGSELKSPTAVALDSAGDVFISDGGNNRVVVVPGDGGPQFTVGASGLSTPVQIAVDSSENLYIVDNGNQRVVKIWANGSAPSTVATGLNDPQGVAVDSAGNVYISELNGNDVIKVAASDGTQSKITGVTGPTQLSLDAAGDLIVAGNGGVWKVASGTSTPVTLVSGIGFVQGIAIDTSDGLYVTIGGQAGIARLQTGYGEFGKTIVCPTGDTDASLCAPTISLSFSVSANTGIDLDGPFSLGAPNGEFSIAQGTTCGDNDGATSCTLAVSFSPKLPGRRLGAVELTDSHGNILSTVSLSGIGLAPQAAFLSNNSQQTLVSNLNMPTGVAVDGSGNRYIADSLNHRVLKISASNVQSTLSTAVSIPTGVAVDGAGNVYVGDLTGGGLYRIPTTGGAPGTFVSGLSQPVGIAIAPSGDVIVADSGNNRVVEFVPGTGTMITLGSGFKSPEAVAVGNGGAIFVADTGNNQVVKLPPGGGQVIVGSGLSAPQGLAIDAAGDLLIADTGNNRVVVVNAAGSQSNLTTNVKAPAGLAFDSTGHIYIADAGNNRVATLPLTAPISLRFASTLIGTTSADSPQNVDVANIGNLQLSVTDVSYPANFPIDFAESEDQELCDGSSVLMSGQSCRLAIDFTPLTPTLGVEHLTITDNTLNTPGSTQTISLTGTPQMSQHIVSLLPVSMTFTPTALTLANFAQATSGLPVSFKVLSGPAKLSGPTLALTGAGTVVIQASQLGNSVYVAATPVTSSIVVSQAVPVVAWSAPAPIVYGTKLGAGQLNAAASVAGKFVYSPALGTVLPVGTQTLTMTFTPTNAAGYATVKSSVKIVVNKAPLTVTANSFTIKAGSAIPTLTVAYKGFVNGDTAKVLVGAPALSTTAKPGSLAGSYSIVVKQGTLAAKNYAFTFVNGTLTISSSAIVKTPGGVSPLLPPRVSRPVGEPLR